MNKEAIETFWRDLIMINPAFEDDHRFNTILAELMHAFEHDKPLVLDLHGISIIHLPDSLARLTSLQSLDLYKTAITAVPEWIGQLTNLQRLDLGFTSITTLPESLGRLANLQELDLAITNITVVPESLRQLTNLQSLDLYNTEITYLPEWIGELTNLQRLNIQDMAITALPEWIGELTNLQSLALGFRETTTLPRSLGKLKNLQELSLQDINITAVPEWIGELTNLRSLIINDPEIRVVPVELGQLTNLQSLNLSGTSITVVPESIGQLTNLQSLNLSGTSITVVPEWLGQLTNLQSLDLNGTSITVVPEWLGQLTNLQSLDLSFTDITTMPAELEQLTSLQSLNLSSTKIAMVPEWIGQLTSLQSLNLSNTSIMVVPESLGQLTSLQKLYLDLTEITTMPAELEQLTSLQSLNLSSTKIAMVPEWIGQLTNLQELYFRNTSITRFPMSMQQLSQLWYLDAHQTLLPIPPEITADARNPRRIFDYYFQPSRPLHEAKIVLVGDGGVGKTSLVRRMIDDAFVDGEDITEGINIRDWYPREMPYRLNVWDFGGQELMHSTHHFFMTKRTMYVLVLSGRTTTDAYRVEYWLKLIESFGDDSPIVIVQNFADQHTVALDTRTLQYKYPTLRGFYRTSCKSGDGIAALRAALVAEIQHLPHINDQIPVHWFDLKERIQQEQRDLVSFDVYQEWCASATIMYQWEQERLIRFLHDLGVVICFYDDVAVGDTAVLNPRWITEGVYQIINAPLLKESGILDCAQLPSILDPNRYPRNRWQYLLNMIEKFELGFFLPDGTKRMLLPGLLPVERPDVGAWDDPLQILYRYTVLPSSILARLMVRLHPLLDISRCWQNGTVLMDDEHGNQALVIADREAREIRIAVIGPPATRRTLLRHIRTTMRIIHASFSALDVDERVPITEAVSVPYTHLLRLEQKGKTEFLPEGLDDDYSIARLLDGIESSAERRLHGSAEYATMRERLKMIGEESLLLLDEPALQQQEILLRDKLPYLKHQMVRLNETAIDYDRQREHDRIATLLELMPTLIQFRRAIER